MLKDNGILKVKLFDADQNTMTALADSGIEVMVAIPNDQLAVMGDYNRAKDWVKRNVTRYNFNGGVTIKLLLKVQQYCVCYGSLDNSIGFVFFVVATVASPHHESAVVQDQADDTASQDSNSGIVARTPRAKVAWLAQTLPGLSAASPTLPGSTSVRGNSMKEEEVAVSQAVYHHLLLLMLDCRGISRGGSLTSPRLVSPSVLPLASSSNRMILPQAGKAGDGTGAVDSSSSGEAGYYGWQSFLSFGHWHAMETWELLSKSERTDIQLQYLTQLPPFHPNQTSGSLILWSIGVNANDFYLYLLDAMGGHHHPAMDAQGGQFRARTEIAPDQREKFLQRLQQGHSNILGMPPLTGGNHKQFSAQQNPLLQQFNSQSSSVSQASLGHGVQASGFNAVTSAALQQPNSIHRQSSQQVVMSSGAKDPEIGHSTVEEQQLMQNLPEDSTTESAHTSGLGKSLVYEDELTSPYTMDTSCILSTPSPKVGTGMGGILCEAMIGRPLQLQIDLAGASGSLTEHLQVPRDIDLSPGQLLQSSQPSSGLGVIGRRSVSDLGAIGDNLTGSAINSGAMHNQLYNLQMLEAAYHKLPQPKDSERARTYIPRHPAATPPSYPQVQLPMASNPAFWERLSMHSYGTATMFFAFYYQQVMWYATLFNCHAVFVCHTVTASFFSNQLSCAEYLSAISGCERAKEAFLEIPLKIQHLMIACELVACWSNAIEFGGNENTEFGLYFIFLETKARDSRSVISGRYTRKIDPIQCIRRRLNPCQLSVQTTTCSFILPFRWSKQHELRFGIYHFLCLQLISSPALSSVPPSTYTVLNALCILFAASIHWSSLTAAAIDDKRSNLSSIRIAWLFPDLRSLRR
uniref:Uncharacterized protein n=1 Tax=Salix viminalis TaxID=40686 RepID=A0A6N2N017_SALVM